MKLPFDFSSHNNPLIFQVWGFVLEIVTWTDFKRVFLVQNQIQLRFYYFFQANAKYFVKRKHIFILLNQPHVLCQMMPNKKEKYSDLNVKTFYYERMKINFCHLQFERIKKRKVQRKVARTKSLKNWSLS